MELRVLGSIEFVDGSGVVGLGTPRQRAVLALLATEAGRVVPADRLAELLWSGEPPEQAMATLQSHISRLRRVLEPDRAPRTPATVLVTQAPGYRLVLGPEQLDARRFEDLVAEARRVAVDDPTVAEARLTEALGLWRGPAYAEFAHEPWAAGEAARLEDVRLGAEEDLLELALRRGDPAVASALEHHVGRHPLRERPYALLALALYRSGRQAEALRALDTIRSQLREQLGLEPGPGLRQLEQAILDHDPALGGDALFGGPLTPSSGPAEVGVPERSAEAAPGPASRLVGRPEVTALLEEVVGSACAGRGRVLLVEGEAGIGKTTVAEAVSGLALAVAGVAAWGRCQDGAASPPFWPVVQALRALLTALPEPCRDALAPAPNPLGELVPDLVGPPPPAPPDPQLLRLRLFDALSAVFLGPAPDRPPVTVVVLDDLHLADPSSLQLVGALARAIEGSSTVLVCTLRPEEVQATPAVADALAELAAIPAVQRVALGPLDPEPLGELLASEAQLSDEVAAIVRERSGGNPYFATELARLLSAEGTTDRVDAARTSVPIAVRDVLRRRLNRLPEEARRLLTVAAIVGTSFDALDVAAISGTDVDAALDLFDLVAATGLVQESASGDWRFSHALVADAVRFSVSSVRLARWHGQAARVLIERHGDDPGRWAAIGAHLLASNDRDDAQRAVPWLQRAAQHAMSSGAFEQAELLFGQVLELLADARPGRGGAAADPGRTVEALLVECRLAYLQVWRAGFAAAPVAEFLVDAARWDPPPTVDAAEVLWNAALHHHQRGELDRSLVQVARLDDLARAAGSDAVALLADDQGAVTMMTAGRFAEALERAARNEVRIPELDLDAAARALQSPTVRLEVIRAMALWHVGDGEGSRRSMQRALDASWDDVFRTSGGFVRRYGVLLGLMADDAGAVREAIGLELAETFYEEFRYPSGVMAFGQAWLAHRQGDPSGLDRMQAAADGLQELGLRVTLPLLWSHLGSARFELGDVDAAEARLRAAVEGAERSEPRWLPDALRRLAEVRAAAGRPEEAAGHLARAREVAEVQGNVALLGRLSRPRSG